MKGKVKDRLNKRNKDAMLQKPRQERCSRERLAASNISKRCSQMERPLGLAAMQPLVSSIQQCQQMEESWQISLS